MAQIEIVYWRDIPAQVIALQGRKKARRVLTERFEKAIDRAAMRSGNRDTDSYLAEWRRGERTPCGDDLEAEAEAEAARIEESYTDERLANLVASDGQETA